MSTAYVIDRFAGFAGVDLLDRAGEVGATWTRHPAHPASGSNDWVIRLGRAYSLNASYGTRAIYLASGEPPTAEYDVVVPVHVMTAGGDLHRGVCFRYDDTLDTGYRLYWESFLARWTLAIVEAGTVTVLDTYADALAADDDRLVRVEVRDAAITVYLDGVARLDSASPTLAAAGRCGLYAWGIPTSEPAVGLHYDSFAVASPGWVPPDYEITGPARGTPGVPSRRFTVELAAGVAPGSVEVTPAATGISGTCAPTSVTLTDAARSATFTFEPDGLLADAGTIGLANDGGLLDPDPLAYEVDYFGLSRLAFYLSWLPIRHHTGSLPYTADSGYALEYGEHYDAILVFYQTQELIVRTGGAPTDWSEEIDAAVVRYRDRAVLAVDGGGETVGVTPFHRYGTGIVRHYYETGDPDDLLAMGYLLDDGSGEDPVLVRENWGHMGVARETAFLLMACLDREWAGMGEHPLADAYAGCILDHVSQYTAPPGTFWGVYCKPFMAALGARSLIAYWDRFRDAVDPGRAAIVAAIPGALADLAAFLESEAWFEVGTPTAIDGGDWDRGAFRYVTVATDDPDLQPITGLTIQAVTSSRVFTGPASLSTVDDFYKHTAIVFDGVADSFLCVGYTGATREFQLAFGYFPTFALEVGDGFEVRAVGPPEVGAGTGAAANLSHMIAPLWAWLYWYTSRVEGDAAASVGYRAFFDAAFEADLNCWTVPTQHKNANQSMLWTPWALDWRERGDAEWPAATTFSLEAPATGASGEPSVASGPFRVSVPRGVLLDGPVHVTPSSSTGRGVFEPATTILTVDRPRALFLFTPDSLDTGETVDVAVAADGLTAPAPVAYEVGGVATEFTKAASASFTLTAAAAGSAAVGRTASASFTLTATAARSASVVRVASASLVLTATATALGGRLRAQAGGVGYLGRAQVGGEVSLVLQCLGAAGPEFPAAAPTARVYRDGVLVRSLALAADPDPDATGLFRAALRLGRDDAPGAYLVVYQAGMGAVPAVEAVGFEVDPGGDAAGPVLATYVLARPEGDAALAHLGSGVLATGRAPYLDEGLRP